MTERNTSNTGISEHDVDRLLQQFFLDEVPAEFRRDKPSVMLAQSHVEPIVRTASSDSSRSLAGLLGILVSATCCLVVTLFIPSTPTGESGPEGAATIGEHDRRTPETESDALPVEERSHLRYTTTEDHAADPGSEPDNIGPLEPELEIEIFPLRPDKPRE